MDKSKKEINSLCRIRVNKMLSTVAQKLSTSSYFYSQSNKNFTFSNNFPKLSNSKSFNNKKLITNNLSKKTKTNPSLITEENYKKKPVDFIINHGLVVYAKNFDGEEIVNLGSTNKYFSKNNYQTHTHKISKNRSNNNLLNKFSKKNVLKNNNEMKLNSVRSERYKSPICFNDSCYSTTFNFHKNVNNKKAVNSKKKHEKQKTSTKLEDKSGPSIPLNNNKLIISEKCPKKMKKNIDKISRNNNFMKTANQKNSNSKNFKTNKTNKELKINTKNFYGNTKTIKNIIFTKLKNSEKSIFPYYRINNQDCLNDKDKEEESTNTNNTNTNIVKNTSPNTITYSKNNFYMDTNVTNVFNTTKNIIINRNNKTSSSTTLQFFNHLNSYIIHYLKKYYLLLKNYSKKSNTYKTKKKSYFFEKESFKDSMTYFNQNENTSNLGSQLSIELNEGNKSTYTKSFNRSTIRNIKQSRPVNCSTLVSLIKKRFRFLSKDQNNNESKKSELFRDSSELSKKMIQIHNRKKKRNSTSSNSDNRTYRLHIDNFNVLNSFVTSPENIDKNCISKNYSFLSNKNMSNTNDCSHNYKLIFLKTREKLKKIRENQKKQNDIKNNNSNEGNKFIQTKVSQKVLIKNNSKFIDRSNNMYLEILSNNLEKNKNKKNKFINESRKINSEKLDNEKSIKEKNVPIRIKHILTKDKRISININYLFFNYSYAKTKQKKFNDLFLVIVKNIIFNYIGSIIHNIRNKKNDKKSSKGSNLQIYKCLSLIKEEEELDKHFSKSIKNSKYFEDIEKIKKLINATDSLNYILLEKKFFFRIKVINYAIILQKIINKKYYCIFLNAIKNKGKNHNKIIYCRKLGKGGIVFIKRKTPSLNKLEENIGAKSFDKIATSKRKLDKIWNKHNNNLNNANNRFKIVQIEKYLKFKYTLISFILAKK